MTNIVKRLFIEKKKGFDVEAQSLFQDLKENLGINNLESVRILNRYDVSGISNEEFNKAEEIIFSEKTVDVVYEENISSNDNEKIFAVEYLPGQYDMRADSAVQCIGLIIKNENVMLNTAKVIILSGNISDEEFAQIKNYCINPVDSREAKLGKPISLDVKIDIPNNVEILSNFITSTDDELLSFMNGQGFAMSFEDLKFCRDYFKNTEKRNPTITEIKVIDTYWSDHCRHTTFMTKINNVKIEEGKYAAPIKNAYEGYLKSREYVYANKKKDICLMDIAVIGMKELKKRGLLSDLDISEEINACSIEVNVDINGKDEKWLVMFKNETHNHPTEIEPFGGAATCLGGAIRDPLSGRSYVYQAMRVTGSGDPRTKIEDTVPGRLPQRKITIGAAHGYSSYGNQIGLSTGQVSEVYDDGFVAKRMEIGAVIAAAPKENVVREVPKDGDIIILLGGRTGRDGCGGATGSSKEHTEESILTCGAEVQKGNPPTERKIQRLFRNSAVSRMIKRCNDFGAGGVSVAIGELSDGLNINLDLVTKKYEGLDGTELAISESQERMAVVIDKKDKEEFIKFAGLENIEAKEVAYVTSDNRLKMSWRNEIIVNISRDFLNTNGVTQNIDVIVEAPKENENYFNKNKSASDIKNNWLNNLMDLNVCSQKGLSERFDSTIGAGTVIMPFGGKYQLTPAEGMAAKIPVLEGKTTTGTLMSYGYNPKIAKWSPFHGAVYAVVEAEAKIVAMGGDYKKIRLTFQEYFERVNLEPLRWGKPFSALIGALYAQKSFGTPAIGGKDSMSGTFKDMNVPPTLVAFAVDTVNVNNVVSPEFKKVNSNVILVKAKRLENE
ncbi:MAG: phosphoribosylformylglycinamidine synthase [Bacillota bacterium]|nr:phosphoribosylformylglycinamidine synthase [Bacillota bacterium]